jgi:NTE family protein
MGMHGDEPSNFPFNWSVRFNFRILLAMRQIHSRARRQSLSGWALAVLLLGAMLSYSGVCHGQAPSAQPPVPPIPTDKAADPAATSSQIVPTLDHVQPSEFLSAIAPAPVPRGPTDRPRIGLALGGGGALAMSEIGVLEWFEDHHIPVDVIAGTSMGCMVSALYSSGKTIDQLKAVMNDQVFSSVFSLGTSYKALNYRRREDSRALPNAISVGLKHGVSFRNSVLVDQGLNAFLDRQFLAYNDETEFNALPIPLRCIATDLTDADFATFTRGSLPDAVRASVSIPGVYRPYRIDGHEFVDGAILQNLPTQMVHDMQADVVLAVSLPISPVNQNDFDSILGVLQRSFSVAIEGNERRSRDLAAVVITPDLKGYNASDYLKTRELAALGYKAAEAHKDELLKYAVDDKQWSAYIAGRVSRMPGSPGTVLHVHVKAPNEGVARAVQRSFSTIVDKPVDPKAIEALLDQVRSDGRYDADYTVGYETKPDTPVPGAPATPFFPNRPVVQVTVSEKRNGPPFLKVGANIIAETSGTTRATLEAILIDQDLGGYGSELRANIKVGFLTELDAEYYRHLAALGQNTGGLFIAPHGGLLRQPYYIYQNQKQLSERLLQNAGGGVDIGWSDQRVQELRLGWQAGQVRWETLVGTDAQPNIIGTAQRARLRYVYDNQDRALVPQFGFRIESEAAYLYNAVGSPNTPQFITKITFAHRVTRNIFVMAAEGGTMLNHNVAQPFRFTLGGPLRLSASAIDEYRGTDYFLVEPAMMRRIAQLPRPLGQSVYIGLGYEAGQMRAPGMPTITRQDGYIGVVAETPLGIITFAPAIGDDGYRKLVFTLGKLF